MEPVCNGRGDGGDHCCYIDGEVCQFLFVDRGGTPRCKVWDLDKWNDDEWLDSPVGRWFKKEWPDQQYTCNDWPQNMPNPELLGGLCCWEGKV